MNKRESSALATSGILFCLAGLCFALAHNPIWVTFVSIGLLFASLSMTTGEK